MFAAEPLRLLPSMASYICRTSSSSSTVSIPSSKSRVFSNLQFFLSFSPSVTLLPGPSTGIRQPLVSLRPSGRSSLFSLLLEVTGFLLPSCISTTRSPSPSWLLSPRWVCPRRIISNVTGTTAHPRLRPPRLLLLRFRFFLLLLLFLRVLRLLVLQVTLPRLMLDPLAPQVLPPRV